VPRLSGISVFKALIEAGLPRYSPRVCTEVSYEWKSLLLKIAIFVGGFLHQTLYLQLFVLSRRYRQPLNGKV